MDELKNEFEAVTKNNLLIFNLIMNFFYFLFTYTFSLLLFSFIFSLYFIFFVCSLKIFGIKHNLRVILKI